jgi:hypothetical protein
MKNIKILTICFFIIIFSCKEKNELFQNFDIKGNKKVFSQILNPNKIRIKSNKIVILESYSSDGELPVIHVVEKEKMEYLHSIGKLGFGPGEISDASSVEFGNSDSTISIYSAVDKKVSLFPLEPVELATSQVKQKNYFTKAYSVLGFTDSTFLGLAVDSRARLLEFDSKGDSISSFGKNENFSTRKDLDPFNLAQINMGWFGANDKKTHFAIASIFTNRIEIFDRKNKSIKTIHVGLKEHTKFDLLPESTGYFVHWDLSSPYYFRDVALTDTHIFALYGGLSEQQIQSNSVIAKTVYVYSLAGDFVAKFNLDTSITSIAVDQNLSKMYGISTDEDPGIVEFDLPKFLED